MADPERLLGLIAKQRRARAKAYATFNQKEHRLRATIRKAHQDNEVTIDELLNATQLPLDELMGYLNSD